jgi:NodT family efflux transporter outer membrane factor (OMF) lipoprotein
MSDRLRHGLAFAMAMLMAACAAGPDYVRPPAPAIDRFTPAPPRVIRSGPTLPEQAVRAGAPIRARWWEAFGSPALDDVVDRALRANPTIDGARATLAQARHELEASQGALAPHGTLAATARRGHLESSRGVTNLFAAEPSIDWNPDVSGGNRRRVEQARALVEERRAQGRAVRLSLAGGTVLQVIAIASSDEQLAAAEEILAADERNVALVKLSAEAGKSAQLEVLTARSQLESDRALLPALRQQAAAGRHALALLVGETPAAWTPPRIALEGLAMPPELPLSIPSEWLRQRPDIEAAEARLRAANANVGIATSALYPSFTLEAAWSATGRTPGALFGGGATPWSIAASLLAPVFDGGMLAAQRATAVDAYAAELAAYRQTILQAFGQVADALEQSRNDGELLESQTRALDAAAAALELTREGYRAGQASLVQLLDAQRLYQQARLGQARALGQRFADCAQWFIVMGTPEEKAPDGAGRSP